MNKKIKVIELLNKIYANLDVPKRLKLGEIEYLYSEIHADYYNKRFEKFLFPHLAIHKVNWLSIELEILEDEEEIDIQDIKEMEYLEDYEADKTDIRLNRDKINEILKAVKQLDKKINKED